MRCPSDPFLGVVGSRAGGRNALFPAFWASGCASDPKSGVRK